MSVVLWTGQWAYSGHLLGAPSEPGGRQGKLCDLARGSTAPQRPCQALLCALSSSWGEGVRVPPEGLPGEEGAARGGRVGDQCFS